MVYSGGGKMNMLNQLKAKRPENRVKPPPPGMPGDMPPMLPGAWQRRAAFIKHNDFLASEAQRAARAAQAAANERNQLSNFFSSNKPPNFMPPAPFRFTQFGRNVSSVLSGVNSNGKLKTRKNRRSNRKTRRNRRS